MPWIAFKLAICIVLGHVFWHPHRVLDSIGARCDAYALNRQVMSLLVTIIAFFRPISSGLIIGIHSLSSFLDLYSIRYLVALILLFLLQSVPDPDERYVKAHCSQPWSLGLDANCLLDIGRVTCFICVTHFILFPRQSTLMRYEKNRFVDFDVEVLWLICCP